MPRRLLNQVAAERLRDRLDPSDPVPLWRQIYGSVRQMLVDGQLAAGARLPATRRLARELGVSRHTVVTAIEQLTNEGYLVGRQGSGTYVNAAFAGRVRRMPRRAGSSLSLSRRGESIRDAPRSPLRFEGPATVGRAFQVGLPAVDAFPSTQWQRLLGSAWTRSAKWHLGYHDTLGVWSLREATAAYLLASRGLACVPEQIVIVPGSQAALDLCSTVLLDPGETVVVEDPGYLGAHGALRSNGAVMAPVPVDGAGLQVDAIDRRAPSARAVYVTPAHQFPTGVTMSLERRLSLLTWADRHGAWIFEDDYDSEFRYGGRPLDPLAALDGTGRVVYIGTFSKVMFPALRLGYLVVPPDLVDGFAAAALCSTIHAPPLEQLALAEFMHGGHFTRHLQQTRALHEERRAVLLEEISSRLAGALELFPSQAGLHLAATLRLAVSDRRVVDAARDRGVEVWPLSLHGLGEPVDGLLLGYGGTPPQRIRTGAGVLAEVLEELAGRGQPASR